MKEHTNGISYSDWHNEDASPSEGDDIEIDVDVDGDSFEDEEWQEHKPDQYNQIAKPQIIEHNHVPISQNENENFSIQNNIPKFKGENGFRWIDRTDKRHYGKCWALCYYNNQPLVIIGPDCK